MVSVNNIIRTLKNVNYTTLLSKLKETKPIFRFNCVSTSLEKGLDPISSVFTGSTLCNVSEKLSKEVAKRINHKMPFKIVLINESPTSQIYRLITDSIEPATIKSGVLNDSILEGIKKHITKFNVSAKKGIQGCHGRQFFDRIFKLSEKATAEKGIDITSFVNKYASSDRFSKVLSYKNADGSLNFVFSRPKNADIVIKNFKMNTIADFPDFSLCTYMCKDKEYQKTVCSINTLKTVLSKLREQVQEANPIKCYSKLAQDGQAERGIFRIATQSRPQCFFVCDSSLYPVEQNFISSRTGLDYEDLFELPVLSIFNNSV